MRQTLSVFVLLVAGCGQHAFEGRDPDIGRIGQSGWANDRRGVIFCEAVEQKSGCPTIRSTRITIIETGLKGELGRTWWGVRKDDGKTGYINSLDWIWVETDEIRAGKVAEKKDCDRRGGVAVGMTKAQVIATCWGKPRSVNTTTTATRTSEQWVYGGGNYLYFDNGILRTIQN